MLIYWYWASFSDFINFSHNLTIRKGHILEYLLGNMLWLNSFPWKKGRTTWTTHTQAQRWSDCKCVADRARTEGQFSVLRWRNEHGVSQNSPWRGTDARGFTFQAWQVGSPSSYLLAKLTCGHFCTLVTYFHPLERWEPGTHSRIPAKESIPSLA